MSQQIEAIYDSGVLRPLEPLALPNQTRVSVTVDVQVNSESSEDSTNIDDSDCRSEWTGEKNKRRVALIDKLIQQSLSPDEAAELDRLTDNMRHHLDTEELVPTEGARQLHRRLLNLSDSESAAR